MAHASKPIRSVGRGHECQICTHPDRASMELGLANKVSSRVLAARYGVSRDSLDRHRRNHMAPELIASLMTRGRMSAIDLENLRITESEGMLQHLVALRGRLYGWADIAEQQGDVKAAASIAGQAIKTIEVEAKLLGEIKTGTTNVTNNVLVMPEFHAFRTALVQALRPYPEAMMAAVAALRHLEAPTVPELESPEEREAAEPTMAKARQATRDARSRKAIEGEARRVGPID